MLPNVRSAAFRSTAQQIETPVRVGLTRFLRAWTFVTGRRRLELDVRLTFHDLPLNGRYQLIDLIFIQPDFSEFD